MTLAAGATVLFKESWTPAWRAELQSGDETRALQVLEAGPGLMAIVVPRSGTLRLTYGAQLSDLVGWVLFGLGLAVAFVTLVRRPR